MKLYIKNMISNRCKIVVKEILTELGLHYVLIDLGEIEIYENLTLNQREILKTALSESGLELIDGKKTILIEKIKTLVIEMIENPEENVKINFSNYLSEKLNHNYNYLASLFSEVQGITIEKFTINHKIEHVKELMIYNELSITEIANIMNYSSTAHLSSQFKKVTGLSPLHFKQQIDKRQSINQIDNYRFGS